MNRRRLLRRLRALRGGEFFNCRRRPRGIGFHSPALHLELHRRHATHGRTGKPRMRAVAQAVIALGAKPEGFSAAELAERVRAQQGRAMASYAARKAAYDLHKLRGKSLVERIGKTRRYRVRRPGIRTLAALLILREQVIKPVLAGVCRPKRGPPPTNLHPLDVHYQNLKVEMLATLRTLKIAA